MKAILLTLVFFLVLGISRAVAIGAIVEGGVLAIGRECGRLLEPCSIHHPPLKTSSCKEKEWTRKDIIDQVLAQYAPIYPMDPDLYKELDRVQCNFAETRAHLAKEIASTRQRLAQNMRMVASNIRALQRVLDDPRSRMPRTYCREICRPRAYQARKQWQAQCDTDELRQKYQEEFERDTYTPRDELFRLLAQSTRNLLQYQEDFRESLQQCSPAEEPRPPHPILWFWFGWSDEPPNGRLPEDLRWIKGWLEYIDHRVRGFATMCWEGVMFMFQDAYELVDPPSAFP